MTHSVNSLNKKAWYRALKVFHIIFWTLTALFSIWISAFVIVDEEVLIDMHNSFITCSDSGDIYTFADLNIKSAENYWDWSKDNLYKAEIKRIETVCTDSQVSLLWQLNFFPVAHAQLIDYKPPVSDVNFEYSLSYKTNILNRILVGVITLISVLVLEFTVRHTFYYVILGQFFPTKNKPSFKKSDIFDYSNFGTRPIECW